MKYRHLLLEVDQAVAVVTMNRPEVRNALSRALLEELEDVFQELDSNARVLASILTGGPAVFAAGADIRALAEADDPDQLRAELGAPWEAVAQFGKPVIAAVNGFALGGGCELALMCDLVIAGDSARFGQPELKLGIMPGAGGTQRWTGLAGKYRAMEVNLLGSTLSARQAQRYGIANRVVPAETTVAVATQIARTLAQGPPLATRLAKQAINAALEVGLQEGLALEHRSFSALFATADQKEGMRAFLEKRPPRFSGG